MANWRRRRQGGEFHDQEAYRVRSDYREPSQSQYQGGETWKKTTTSVPRWEKKFCWVVGGMTWQRFMESKRYVHLSENILEWDDSAGAEAFQVAKRRFWSELHGVPCRGLPSPPGPESTAGPVDWDAPADPALYSDLHLESLRRQNPAPLADKDAAAGPGLTEALLLAGPAVSCTGWGDLEEKHEEFEYPADRGLGGRRKESRKVPLRRWNVKSSRPQQVS